MPTPKLNWKTIGRNAVDLAKKTTKYTRHWYEPTQFSKTTQLGKTLKAINVTRPEVEPIQALVHELGHSMDPKSKMRSTQLQDEAVANAFARKLILQLGGTAQHVKAYNKSKAIQEGYASYKPYVGREAHNAAVIKKNSQGLREATGTLEERIQATTQDTKKRYRHLLLKKSSVGDQTTKAVSIMEKIALSSELLERASKRALELGQKGRATMFRKAFEHRLNQELDMLYGADKLVSIRGSRIGRRVRHGSSGIGDWKSNHQYK